MLFRPEEIHGTSGIGQVVEPILEGNRGISHDTFGLSVQNGSILHFHPERSTTIQTGRFNVDCLPWEKPADRQRFEPSLGEPLLLAVDRDPVLGGKIAERWK